jgi:hypothetical protein
VTNQVLKYATKYVYNYGLSVIPILPRDKKPAVPWEEFQSRKPTLKELREWFGEDSHKGVAVVLGRISSNLVAVDDDVRERVPEEPLPDLSSIRTVAVRTGSENQGFHRYFHHNEVFGKVLVGPGMQIRGEGHYTILPPSIHPSGGAYEFLPSQGFDDVGIAWLPENLLVIAKRRSPSGTTSGASMPDILVPGERHAWLISLAGVMRFKGAGAESILAALSIENEIRCRPPKTDEELARIANYTAQNGDLSLREQLRQSGALKKAGSEVVHEGSEAGTCQRNGWVPCSTCEGK